MRALHVDVWADIACPWCWVGKRCLEEAVAAFRRDPGGEVDLHWRAFELSPNAPDRPDGDRDYADHLASKYGTSRAEAEAMLERMVGIGAERGLSFRFDRVRKVRTFDAHRVVAHVRDRGLQDSVVERLFRAYMSEGRLVADTDTLAKLAAEAGADGENVRAALATGAHEDDVRGDEARASALGITSVPTVVIEGRYVLVGAEAPESIAGALRRAADDARGGQEGAGADAGACPFPAH